MVKPILHGGGVKQTPRQFFDRGSSGNASNELIFHDFVPFNNQQDLEKPFFRFFSNFGEISPRRYLVPYFDVKFGKLEKNPIFL